MMKKIMFVFVGLFLMINVASAQVDDRAVIPVAVTLNSILRLNIVSGGNIEFNFNTLADYTNGIPNTTATDTRFTVASSTNWEVLMYTEDGTLIGTDQAGTPNTMALDNIGFTIDYTGTGDPADYTYASEDGVNDPVGLLDFSGAGAVIVGNAADNAGDVTINDFTIKWRCGTGPTEGGSMNPATILSQSLAADRFATNVFLILQPE